MTLAQIRQLALRQLDEDPADMDEYADLLGMYINEGYHIAVHTYLRPRDRRAMRTDKDGCAPITDSDIERIIQLTDEDGRDVWFDLAGDGLSVSTTAREKTLCALCEIRFAPLEEDTDDPKLPAAAHSALADYACYRLLSNGNLAKQSRATFYQGKFLEGMSRVKPQGFGSVTRYKNLYAVTDARYSR